MSQTKKSSYIIVRWTFSRFLAVIYLFAFLSFLSQSLGLYGSDGILPIADSIKVNWPDPSIDNFFKRPTLYLFWNNDAQIVLIPTLGVITSILALLGLFTGPSMFLSWIFYLSIINAASTFMSFQWDILLLEVGFLAIFFCSWKPIDSLLSMTDLSNSKWAFLFEQGCPSIIIVWLYRWLLFRLMFESGLVKFVKENPYDAWVNLTALQYHYETQPLPTPIGWLVHQLPQWYQSLSVIGTFVIELVVPLMFFMPAKLRYIAGIIQIILQILIILTGNYCFFNLLTIALCLFLFDDKFLNSLIGNKFSMCLERIQGTWKPNRLRLLYLLPLVMVISLVSGLMFKPTRVLFKSMPPPVFAIVEAVYPFNLCNSYGLFAQMTLSRPEISVEASMDGVDWQPYIFKYKVGPLKRSPPIIAPMQPRLDWQMWFASLGDVYSNPWFVRFCQKLLTNSNEVKDLLEKVPFEGKQPKYIRAILYDYKMTDIAELTSQGNWWKRTYTGVYMPPISIKSFQAIQ